ncbi:DUF6302 family protein [Streptomyces sp. NBC_00838]|uniref:DUF6302 family protein n=1 Tax=Streptomyces sp. NBC_00838 TaxID=2903680 RepID=UPI00386B6B93|nr:DUF6302 family protein [Streptomyces sp. NBC_00838]
MSIATVPGVAPHAPVPGDVAPRLTEFAVPSLYAGLHPDRWAGLLDNRTSWAPPTRVAAPDEPDESLLLGHAAPKPVTKPVLLTADHALDLEHWAEHLLNPALLVHAAALQVSRRPLLLVPVGDTRRGGILSLRSLELGVRIIDLIHNRPGFQDCRLLLSKTRRGAHAVLWGETLTAGASDGEAVRFYGLRSGDNVRALVTHAQLQLLRSYS